MTRAIERPSAAPEHLGRRTPLVLLVAVGTVLAAILWASVGPPTAAWSLPDLARVREALTATSVTHGDAVAVAAAAAWVVLVYLAVTVTLRGAAVGADRATHGARWARTALRLTNLITIPAVRRVVDGGVAGTLLVAGWMPATARVALAEPFPPAVVALAPAAAAHDDREGWSQQQQEERLAVRWTTRTGETPWTIARAMYGDGTRQVDLLEANRGRLMADGQPLDEPRAIPIGSEVLVPLPAQRIAVEQGVPAVQVVRGDTLWDLAGTFLGDPFRWPEIREANRDRDMGRGMRFTNPDLIYPGWELILPGDAVVAFTPAAVPPPDVEPVVVPSATPAAEEAPASADDGQDTAGGLQAPAGGASGDGWSWPAPPRPLVITAAGFAVLGAAAIFVHRAHTAGRLPMPSFGRPRLASTGDAARVALTARALAHAIADAGHEDASVWLVHELEDELVCTIAGDTHAVATSADDLAEAMGCAVNAAVLDEQHVELTLTGVGEATLRLGERQPAGRALMLPVGTDTNGRITYVNLVGAGSVLVTGIEAERRDALHAWTATLATTAGADEVSLRTDALNAALIGDDLDLPHFAATDAPDTALLVDELEDVMQSRDGSPSPRALVALLDVGEAAARCDTVVLYGATAGVYPIGVERRPGAAAQDAALFGAVVELGVADADAGGEPVAADGSVRLTVRDLPPMRLDPVLVRRDTSPRWRSAAPLSPALPATAAVVDEARLASPADGDGATYDWSRAVWEPTAERATRFDPEMRPPLEEHIAADDEDATTGAVSDLAVPTTTERSESNGPRDEDVPAEVAERTPVGSSSPPAADREPDPTTPAEIALTSDVERTEASSVDLPADASDDDQTAPTGVLRQQSLFAAAPDAAGDGACHHVEVRCLGDLEIRVAGEVVTTWRYEKTREMIALLVAYGGAALTRKTAAAALWPDVDWDSSARHLMNNSASTFRRTVRAMTGIPDLDVLSFSMDRYQLQPGILWSDVEEFETTLQRASTLPPAESLDLYERALALYRGDFMASDDFDWIRPYRREYRKRFVAAVGEAGERAIAVEEMERAIRILRAGLEQAPDEEGIAHALMRALGAIGDPSGAVKVYQVHTEAIREALGMPTALPSADMRQLLDALTAGAAAG